MGTLSSVRATRLRLQAALLAVFPNNPALSVMDTTAMQTHLTHPSPFHTHLYVPRLAPGLLWPDACTTGLVEHWSLVSKGLACSQPRPKGSQPKQCHNAHGCPIVGSKVQGLIPGEKQCRDRIQKGTHFRFLPSKFTPSWGSVCLNWVGECNIVMGT